VFACEIAYDIVNYSGMYPDARQALTLAHFSAQLERFLCDRGCT
jgi:hypothetical protein